MNTDQLTQHAIAALEDLKGSDITILNVSSISNVTDIMIIVSGGSVRQVKALANNVNVQVKAVGVIPLGTQGDDVGEWIIVDLGDVVVHVMLPTIRAFYNLEKLWGMPDEADNAQQL